MKKEKINYYRLDKILELGADYNIIFGERSDGKTTSVLEYGLKRHVESGYVDQLAIIRRWEEDFKGKNGQNMFSGIVKLGWVEKYTNGKYNSIYYYGQRWFLATYDETGKKINQAEEPFALGFSITSEEHYKSTSYPKVKVILFDEFITRSYYIADEFVKYQNLLSTIIRLSTDVIIFMCGNTINQYCPYFTEMGLRNVKKQKQGTIDLYTYGENDELKVAVEFTSQMGNKSKKSNKYFAFDNPKLQMIKCGAWELNIYPHLPAKYQPKDILYTYFIKFDDTILQCEIVYSNVMKNTFTYIHRKTTPIKADNQGIVFDTTPNALPNYRRKITLPTDEYTKRIYKFFLEDKVFYQDNEVGELVKNYIVWCKKEGV